MSSFFLLLLLLESLLLLELEEEMELDYELSLSLLLSESSSDVELAESSAKFPLEALISASKVWMSVSFAVASQLASSASASAETCRR